MTDDMHSQTRQLITSIERKDRRFRSTALIFMVAVLIALGMGGYFVVQGFKTEQAKRDQTTNDIIKAQSAKIDELSNKLQCITIFFAQPDRANLIITDPNDCFTKRLDNGDIRQLVTNPEPNTAKENNNTNTEASQGNTQKAPDQTPIVTPPDVGSGEADKPPREVLGIPVCVPFTNVCVR